MAIHLNFTTMKKFVFMALAALCFAVVSPVSFSQVQAQSQQYEHGELMRIFDVASVQFAKVGLSYSIGDLMQGYKAGTVTVQELPSVPGQGGSVVYSVSAGGNVTIILIDDIY